MVFPVVRYGHESWTTKKDECRRIDAFELWCWEKTLESPLDNMEIQPVNSKGNQSWIFIGRNDVEAETPILWPPDVKTHLWLRCDSFEKILMLGRNEGLRRGRQRMRWWDGFMASWTWWTWVWGSSGSWWWTGKPGVLQSMGSQKDMTEGLNWTV